MLPASLGRKIRSSPFRVLCPLISTTSPSHQRRHSSSKASYPPGDPRGTEAAAESGTKTSTSTVSRALGEEKTSIGRLRRKSKDLASAERAAISAKDEAFANLPAVPSTNHLQLSDVHTSSFFSLHRPISVTNPFPLETFDSSFDAIFKDQPLSSMKEVIYTLSSAVAALGGAAANAREEKDLRWEILQQAYSNEYEPSWEQRFLLNEVIAQCTPFKVPPPPIPFDQEQPVQLKRSRREQSSAKLQPWMAANVQQTVATLQVSASNSVTKTTPFAQGRALELSPLPEEADNYTTSSSSSLQKRRLAQSQSRMDKIISFRVRRGQMRGSGIWAISVKRQRKLKMKKHKYKKLMRRTRNLRRREGRS